MMSTNTGRHIRGKGRRNMDNRTTIWKRAIRTADSLIELYEQRMSERPEEEEHYKRKIAMTMCKRFLIIQAMENAMEVEA